MATQTEGANRLRNAQISFITTRRERSSSSSASHVSQPDSQQSATQQSGEQSCITERITPSAGHSHAQTAIRVCGVMMSPDDSERAGGLIRCGFATRDCCRSVLQVPLSRRSHWRWMTSVVIDWDSFLHVLLPTFDRLGRCLFIALGDTLCLLCDFVQLMIFIGIQFRAGLPPR